MLTPCTGSLRPSKADALSQQHLCCLCPWQVLAGKRDRRWFRFSPPLSRQACRDSREGCAHRECCLPCLLLLLLGLLCLGQGHPGAPHTATTGTQRARSSSAAPILPNPQQLRKNYYFCLFFCLSRCSQSVLCACTVILPL